jgi:hypothetical protein
MLARRQLMVATAGGPSVCLTARAFVRISTSAGRHDDATPRNPPATHHAVHDGMLRVCAPKLVAFCSTEITIDFMLPPPAPPHARMYAWVCLEYVCVCACTCDAHARVSRIAYRVSPSGTQAPTCMRIVNHSKARRGAGQARERSSSMPGGGRRGRTHSSPCVVTDARFAAPPLLMADLGRQSFLGRGAEG